MTAKLGRQNIADIVKYKCDKERELEIKSKNFSNDFFKAYPLYERRFISMDLLFVKTLIALLTI